MAKPIAFDAELRQVKTMVDHTVNITLNIPEYDLDKVGTLLYCIGDQVHVALVVEDEKS